MTLLIATVTPKVGYLSQDTFVSKGGRGDPDASELLCHMPKIGTLGHLRLMVGSAGSLGFHLKWLQALSERAPGGDLSVIDGEAPALLRQLHESQPDPQEQVVVHVGYSHRLDHVMGFCYASFNGFRSEPLNAGHTMTPEVNPEGPDYDVIADTWARAAEGDGTESFHVRVAINQHDSSQRGLFPGGSGIGGELWTAKVDRDGMSMWIAHSL